MRRTVTLLIVGMALGLSIAHGWIHFTDRVLWTPHRYGTPTDTTLDFSPSTKNRIEHVAADGARPRNIILVVADGLGMSHLLLGRAKLGNINEPLFVERLPFRSWLTTHAFERIYTDSGAAAAAMATGFKVIPTDLSVDPTGRRLLTAAESAKANGKAIGLVTDSYLWDATPGAFVAHINRGEYNAVGSAMATSGFDLFVGTVRHGYAGVEDDELIDEFRTHGFAVSRTLDGFRSASLPALGLFAEDSIAGPESPDLLELAEISLDRLARRSPDGFFLLLETEEADSGSHRHENNRVMEGILTFDHLVRLAVQFAEADGHTLVLATADHETGGLMVLRGSPGKPLRIRWGSTNHTASPVPIFAYGPAANRVTTLTDNTDLGRLLLDLVENG